MANLTGGCSAARCARVGREAGLFERLLLPHVQKASGQAFMGLTGGIKSI